MDETTPHLNIDFVPSRQAANRGWVPGYSSNRALAAQGFTGGTWGGNRTKPVGSIGKEFATVMVRYGIQ